jgi:rhodanese-related sulfurtransferase
MAWLLPETGLHGMRCKLHLAMTASAGRRLLCWSIPILALVLPLFTGCASFRKRGQRPPFKKLSPPVAYEMMRDSPDMLILDLRPPQEYNGETGHLRRAQNIPLERLPYRLLEISPFREETVLVYCRADDCGEKGIAVLVASGFENAVLMDGGIDAWIRGGFKTVLPAKEAGRTGQPADANGPVRPARPGEKEVAPRQEVPVVPPPPLQSLSRETL